MIDTVYTVALDERRTVTIDARDAYAAALAVANGRVCARPPDGAKIWVRDAGSADHEHWLVFQCLHRIEVMVGMAGQCSTAKTSQQPSTPDVPDWSMW